MRRFRVGSAAFFALNGILFAWGLCHGSTACAHDCPKVTGVEMQPLGAATDRLIEALEFIGAPLPAKDRQAIKEALADTNSEKGSEKLQAVLDPLCLVAVIINPESRVSVVAGTAPKELLQNS